MRPVDWVQSGSLRVDWALRYDTLSAVMVGMVSFVAMLIHIYTVGYMAHEPDGSRYRFMGYISLFTFAMLMLVTSDNLLQLFFGWEGVGFCSYLLIGYWFDREYANDAAIKAFVVTRVGDLCFALGIALTGEWAQGHDDTLKQKAQDALTKADSLAKAAGNQQLALAIESFMKKNLTQSGAPPQ